MSIVFRVSIYHLSAMYAYLGKYNDSNPFAAACHEGAIEMINERVLEY